ncbi:MAG: ribosome-binding factor A [Deltaproteobacteria bacterium]|nr:ribosome-binding factor A [Deltaproteobacteria bacterium]
MIPLSPKLWRGDDGLHLKTKDSLTEKYFGDRESRGASHRAEQLAAQIERALQWVFGGELADQRLHDAFIDSVRPAPDASRFEVIVIVRSPEAIEGTRDALRAAAPYLRSQVARGIHRKRVPELAYVCLAPPKEAS